MDGRCLMTTSRAWIVSKGTLGSRPESASCNACKLTQDTHLMDTLKMRSFPSPGSVTSSSTWEGTQAHGYLCFLRKLVGSFHGPERRLPVAKPAKHSFHTSFPTQPRSAPLQGGEGDAELRPRLGVMGLHVEGSAPLPGPAGFQSTRGQGDSAGPPPNGTGMGVPPLPTRRSRPPKPEQIHRGAGAKGQHCRGLGGFCEAETPGRGKRDAGINKAVLGMEERGAGSSLGVLDSYSFSGGAEKTAEDVGWGVPVSWVSESIS